MQPRPLPALGRTQLWLWVTRAFTSQILIGVAEASAQPLLGSDTMWEGQELAWPCKASWAWTQGPRGPCLPSVATCEQAQASFL